MILNDALLTREEQVIFLLRDLFEKHGFSRFAISRFEEYDLYVRHKDFLVSDRIITFNDLDGRLMALKPDVTMSVIRHIKAAPGKVDKLYYKENVYRVPKGSRHFKEIMQTGIECIGDLTPENVNEAIVMAVESLAVIKDRSVLNISHTDFEIGLMKSCGILADQFGRVCEYVSEKNSPGLQAFCRELALSEEASNRLQKLISVYGCLEETMEELRALAVNPEMERAVKDIEELYRVLRAKRLADRVFIDFSVVNTMAYYDGIVFQGFVSGIPTGILSGGQYSSLMRRMGKNARAIGFAVYLNELEYLDHE